MVLLNISTTTTRAKDATFVNIIFTEGKPGLHVNAALVRLIPCTGVRDKITHPLGRISEPVFSKPCLMIEGTHNENGDLGHTNMSRNTRTVCISTF